MSLFSFFGITRFDLRRSYDVVELWKDKRKALDGGIPRETKCDVNGDLDQDKEKWKCWNPWFAIIVMS